ncbi:hypothetical protein F0243_26205 [Vibrio mediterranei]|nr:hypothetical protein [Vibrio mediterranei]
MCIRDRILSASYENVLAASYLGKGELNKAEEYFNKARFLSGNSISSRNNIAYLYMISHRYDEAESILNGIINTNPKYQRAISNLKLCKVLQKQKTKTKTKTR